MYLAYPFNTVFNRSDKSEDVPIVTPRRKWWLPPLLGVLALAGLGFAGLKLYRRLEPERLARKAETMIQAGDFRGAILTLSRALQINANSDKATRAMGDLMEHFQMPQAIEWRQRAVDLNPGSLPDALALANLALREGKTGVAQRALDTVPSDGRGNAQWHSRAGLVAIRSGRWQTAREHFTEAARLEPNNDMHRYNLALVRLQSKDADERAAAIEALNQPKAQGRVQVFSQRALIEQLVRDGKVEDALARSTALLQSPDAEIVDHIAQIDLLRKAKREWAPALEKAKAKAIERAPDAGVLIQWLRLHEQAEDALAWSKQFPPALLADRAVQAALGDCLFTLRRWDELKAATVKSNWGPANARRMALLARASSELGDPQGMANAWTEAIKFAKGNRGQLGQLAALASDWGWKLQMRDSLWAAVECPSPDWALRLLHRSYIEDGETALLLRVARRQVALDPTDLRARNNAALFALLLGTDLPRSLTTARELAADAPQDPIIRSTYAFALLVNKRNKEALKEIEKIPNDKLKEPAFALYYGLILAANGNLEPARDFLKLTEKERLLPEESSLRQAVVNH